MSCSGAALVLGPGVAKQYAFLRRCLPVHGDREPIRDYAKSRWAHVELEWAMRNEVLAGPALEITTEVIANRPVG